MKKEDVRLSFRPSDKNQIYLQKLGFLDARTGRLRKEGLDFSRFLNEVITNTCEQGSHERSKIISSDDLQEAYRKHCISVLMSQVDNLNKKVYDLEKRKKVK